MLFNKIVLRRFTADEVFKATNSVSFPRGIQPPRKVTAMAELHNLRLPLKALLAVFLLLLTHQAQAVVNTNAVAVSPQLEIGMAAASTEKLLLDNEIKRRAHLELKLKRLQALSRVLPIEAPDIGANTSTSWQQLVEAK